MTVLTFRDNPEFSSANTANETNLVNNLAMTVYTPLVRFHAVSDAQWTRQLAIAYKYHLRDDLDSCLHTVVVHFSYINRFGLKGFVTALFDIAINFSLRIVIWSVNFEQWTTLAALQSYGSAIGYNVVHQECYLS